MRLQRSCGVLASGGQGLCSWPGLLLGGAASGNKEDESQTSRSLQREMKSLRIPFALRGGGQRSRAPTVPEDSVPWPSLAESFHLLP